MTTDTAVAGSEADVSEFPPWPIAEETLASNESWRYLFVRDMPVRPATDEELAAYKTRYDDDSFAHIYAPPEPHIVLPPSHEVAELTEIAAGSAEAQPTPAADEDGWAFGAEHAQQDAVAALGRWSKGITLADADDDAGQTVTSDPAATRFLDAFKEDPEGEKDRAQPPEVHHDTRILPAGDES
jgi:hypothetical protein